MSRDKVWDDYWGTSVKDFVRRHLFSPVDLGAAKERFLRLRRFGLDPYKMEDWTASPEHMAELDRQDLSMRWLGHPYGSREEALRAQGEYELRQTLSETTGVNKMGRFNP